jgi:hypothetical protein
MNQNDDGHLGQDMSGPPPAECRDPHPDSVCGVRGGREIDRPARSLKRRLLRDAGELPGTNGPDHSEGMRLESRFAVAPIVSVSCGDAACEEEWHMLFPEDPENPPSNGTSCPFPPSAAERPAGNGAPGFGDPLRESGSLPSQPSQSSRSSRPSRSSQPSQPSQSSQPSQCSQPSQPSLSSLSSQPSQSSQPSRSSRSSQPSHSSQSLLSLLYFQSLLSSQFSQSIRAAGPGRPGPRRGVSPAPAGPRQRC